MKVVAPNNDCHVHLGAMTSTSKDATPDRNSAGEWALLVEVSLFPFPILFEERNTLGCFKNAFSVYSAMAEFGLAPQKTNCCNGSYTKLGHVLRECLEVEEARDVKSEDSLRLSVCLRASSPLKKDRYGSGRSFDRNWGKQKENPSGYGREGSCQDPREKGLMGYVGSENVCTQPDMECLGGSGVNNCGYVMMGQIDEVHEEIKAKQTVEDIKSKVAKFEDLRMANTDGQVSREGFGTEGNNIDRESRLQEFSSSNSLKPGSGTIRKSDEGFQEEDCSNLVKSSWGHPGSVCSMSEVACKIRECVSQLSKWSATKRRNLKRDITICQRALSSASVNIQPGSWSSIRNQLVHQAGLRCDENITEWAVSYVAELRASIGETVVPPSLAQHRRHLQNGAPLCSSVGDGIELQIDALMLGWRSL
ncbi:hypothetical protein QYF36_013913 [Acer negundo]|nr:hypothetical protein QYF36_013913 [Acer negundo]